MLRTRVLAAVRPPRPLADRCMLLRQLFATDASAKKEGGKAPASESWSEEYSDVEGKRKAKSGRRGNSSIRERRRGIMDLNVPDAAEEDEAILAKSKAAIKGEKENAMPMDLYFRHGFGRFRAELFKRAYYEGGIFEKKLMSLVFPTVPAAPPIQERATIAPEMYTLRDVVTHTKEDVGKYYVVPQATADALAQMDINYCLKTEFRDCGLYMMVRSSAWKMKEYMTKFDPTNPKGKFNIGVHGPSGCGKSSILHYLAQYAIASPDWLVLYADAHKLVDDKLGLVARHNTIPYIWNQTRLTKKYMNTLATMQKDKLQRLKITRVKEVAEWVAKAKAEAVKEEEELLAKIKELSTTVGSAESTVDVGAFKEEREFFLPEDKELMTNMDLTTLEVIEANELKVETLYDLIRYGERLPRKFAPYAFEQVIEELKVTQEMKVVVLVDNVNAFSRKSDFRLPGTDHAPILAADLSLVNTFRSFEITHPNNGLVFFAAGSQHGKKFDTTVYDDLAYAAPFSRQETLTCLNHYNFSRFLNHRLAPDVFFRFYQLTQGYPREVYRLSSFY